MDTACIGGDTRRAAGLTDVVRGDLHWISECVLLGADESLGVLLVILQKIAGTFLQLTLNLLPVTFVLGLKNDAGCLQNIL